MTEPAPPAVRAAPGPLALRALGYNERRILSVLRSRGPQSRAALGRLLDITPPTVTRLSGQLIAEGILTEAEDPARAGRKGYPAKLLHVAAGGMFSAGVFIDPDHVLTCLMDMTGRVLGEEALDVPDRSFQRLMTSAGESVGRLVAQAGIDPARVVGCGVSYPGQHTEDPSRTLRIQQFADWPSLDVRRDLTPFFGMPVRHMNDAKAASLAELYHGACRDQRTFCHVWLSYGIGGAVIIDQAPYLGRNRGAAEWGGLFPKSRPRPSGQDLLDTAARAGLVLRRLRDLESGHLAHPAIRDWRERASEQLRWLCLVIARTFAPDAIVIGGTLHPDLLDAFVADLSALESLGEDHFIAPPRILRAEQDRKPQLGAAALPIHDLLNPARAGGPARKGW